MEISTKLRCDIGQRTLKAEKVLFCTMVMRAEESLVARPSMPSSSTTKMKAAKQWEEVEVS